MSSPRGAAQVPQLGRHSCKRALEVRNLQSWRTLSAWEIGVSVKSCKELGWFSPYPGRVTSDKVCGASDKIKGGCAGSREYDSAKSICEADGGRLCSMEELEGELGRSSASPAPRSRRLWPLLVTRSRHERQHSTAHTHWKHPLQCTLLGTLRRTSRSGLPW